MSNLIEKTVQRELTRLDTKLFLDKRWSPLSGIYYCVCRSMEDGSAPLVAVDWREGTYPKPLSLDIVDRVRSQEGDITEAIRATTVNNAVRKELARQEALKEQETIIEDYQKTKPGKVSVVIPNSLKSND